MSKRTSKIEIDSKSKPYDRALKGLSANLLAQSLTGGPARVRELRANLPIVRDRITDRLLLVEDPPRRLLHAEILTKPISICERMFFYLADIWDAKAEDPELCDLDVEQHLVYVGSDPWNPTTSIKGKDFSFRHHATDVRTWDPTPYLEAENPNDVACSVLCRGGSDPAMLNKVLGRMEPVPEPRRADSFTTLTILSNLRGIVPLIVSEIKRMGIDYDFAESEAIQEIVRAKAQPLLQEAAERVREAEREAAERKREAAEREREAAEREREAAEREREAAERVQEAAERVREAAERVQEAAEREREAAEREQEAAERERVTTERARQEKIDLVVQMLQLQGHDVPASLRDRLQACAQEKLVEEIAKILAGDN